MKSTIFSRKTVLTLSATLALLVGAMVAQENRPASVAHFTGAFDQLSGPALIAMIKKAEELKIKGVAVLAYAEGESVTRWSSKMAVVGSLKNPPSGNSKGVNLLAIAYSKAAEMADTLKDSGSGVRPPLNGEFGWQGGLVSKTKTGYLFASFSGGPSADDLKVARVGLDMLSNKL